MRKNECLHPECQSRACYERIVRVVYHVGERVTVFDEISCSKHVDYLYERANLALGRGEPVMRNHISSSSHLTRGDKYD